MAQPDKPREKFDPYWCRKSNDGVDTKEKFIQTCAREKPGFHRGARVRKREPGATK